MIEQKNESNDQKIEQIAPTNKTLAQKDEAITVSTILEVLRVTAPDQLTSEMLQASNGVSVFVWLRDVEKWTNQLFLYSQLLTLTEEDKEIVIEALQNYYSEEQASWLFNTYFEQESDGTYILIPQDAFGDLSHIQFSLLVDIAEADDRYHIEMVGSFSDSLEEVMEMQVVEKVTILKDTLQIDSVEARIE